MACLLKTGDTSTYALKNFHKELFGWDFGQMVEGCHVKEVEGRHKVTFSEVDSIK